MKELAKWLREHAEWHDQGIARLAPEVVAHVKQLRQWADDAEQAVDLLDKALEVDAEALYQVLQALSGPGHYIRELQATRSPLIDNPIDKLCNQYNEWATKQIAAEDKHD